MGYQQSVVKVKEGETSSFLEFFVNNEEWFAERDFRVYGAAKVLKPFELLGSVEFEKGEIVFIVGGERYPQRYGSDEGISELPQVEYCLFTDCFTELSDKDEMEAYANLGEILDEYLEFIKDKKFYTHYKNLQ